MANWEKPKSNKAFLSIVQGSLRQSVPEGTPDAVRREWEAGGNKGVKYERVFEALSGRITKVDFFEGEKDGRKFQNLNITLHADEGEKEPVISVGVGTRYAQDILKKLPNVDLNEEVRIRPYSFQPEDKDKPVTGVEIMQRGGTGQFDKKIASYFHKQDKQSGRWVATNGFPVPEGDTNAYTSDDWDIFYKQSRRFLVTYTKENVIPKFDGLSASSPRPAAATVAGESAGASDYPEEEINPDDIPF